MFTSNPVVVQGIAISVSVHEHISKTRCLNFTNFMCMLLMAVDRFSPVALIRYLTSHQSNLRRVRRFCRTIQHSHSGTPQIHLQNCPFHFDDHHPSNIPIIRLTPLTIPNGIQIHSTVLPQYTRVDRQRDRSSDRNAYHYTR